MNKVKVKNYSYSTVASERINFNYNVDNKFDLGASAGYSFNNATYTVQNSPDNTYFSQTYSIDLTYTVIKGFMIANDF